MSTAHTAAVSHVALNRVTEPPADNGAASFIRSLDSISFQTTCSKGSILFREGERPQGVVVVARGAVKLTMTSSDGVTLIIRTAGDGEILGLSAAVLGCPYQLTAETLLDCRVKLISREDFLAWLENNPAATFRVAEQLAQEYHATAEQMRTILLPHTATQRLARLLLDLGSQREISVSGHERMHLSLTHQEIAETIGASRETVTRLIASLRRKQLIKLRGTTLVIPDKEALRKLEEG